MSEQGDLNQAIVEEGGTEQEPSTPENGIVKSESLDEEEKLELQVSLGKTTLPPLGTVLSFIFRILFRFVCFLFFQSLVK